MEQIKIKVQLENYDAMIPTQQIVKMLAVHQTVTQCNEWTNDGSLQQMHMPQDVSLHFGRHI